MVMVEVVTQTDFDVLKAIVIDLENRLVAVEASVKVMPPEIKVALKTVLEWMDTNV